MVCQCYKPRVPKPAMQYQSGPMGLFDFEMVVTLPYSKFRIVLYFLFDIDLVACKFVSFGLNLHNIACALNSCRKIDISLYYVPLHNYSYS